MLAPPGAGKGTLSSKLVARFSPQLSIIGSGDLLRKNILEKTPLGLAAKIMVEGGGYVKDELMMKLIVGELHGLLPSKSFILDVFPRTSPQAEGLDQILLAADSPLNFVVNLDVPSDIIIQRIEDRWVHGPSGRVYNLSYNPPKVNGLDDETGEPLIKRADDNADIYRARLALYNENTTPLLEHYDKKGVLWTVSGPTTAVIWPKLEKEMTRRFNDMYVDKLRG